MFHLNRVIISKNGTLTDLTPLLSDPYQGKYSATIVAAQDKLYIGSDLPFSHRFFVVPPAQRNSIAGSVSVKIWDGSAWTSAVDVQDSTQLESGVPFSQSGLIRFRPAVDSGWATIPDPADVAALSTLKIYDYYWAELTFSAAFVFDLEYVGFAFAKDTDLTTYYRDLLRADVRKAFNNNVAMDNWDKVHAVAAEEVIRDLRQEDVILSPNQVLLPEFFTDAACHKLAEMVYSQRGEAAEGRLDFARKKYKEAMSRKNWGIDKNATGTPSKVEREGPRMLRRV